MKQKKGKSPTKILKEMDRRIKYLEKLDKIKEKFKSVPKIPMRRKR